MASNREPEKPRVQIMRVEISWRTLLSIVAVVLGLWLTAQIWPIILLLVIGLILAGTFSPSIGWLERHKVPRPLGLGIILLSLVTSVVGLVALVVPALAGQISNVIENAPAMRNQVADWMMGIPMLAPRAQQLREAQFSKMLELLDGRALSYAGAALQMLTYSLLAVILAFYLLADHERVRGFLFALLPRSYHVRTARVLIDMETIVGGYVRGQVLTSLLIGIFTLVTLMIAGVPNAFALAVLAAAFDLVPLVGPILAVIVPTLMSLPQGSMIALGVFIALFIYNQIENHYLLPRVYGQTMRLSPVVVLVALLVGGQLLGLVGALLALPIAAGIRVLIEDLRIELPGEHTGEYVERIEAAAAERRYAAETANSSAREAAVVADTIAEQLQPDDEANEQDQREPVEERDDSAGSINQAQKTARMITKSSS